MWSPIIDGNILNCSSNCDNNKCIITINNREMRSRFIWQISSDNKKCNKKLIYDYFYTNEQKCSTKHNFYYDAVTYYRGNFWTRKNWGIIVGWGRNMVKKIVHKLCIVWMGKDGWGYIEGSSYEK